MEDVQRAYLSAAERDWALPFYDTLVRLMGAEKVRNALLEQAGLQPGYRILDIGCGTGTMATSIKSGMPPST